MINHPYEPFLDEVRNPSQYVGNEVRAVVKEKGGVRCRVALCFPELYSIGMSHLGLKILYSVVNNREGLWAERFFAPEPDMEAMLRREGQPLRSLESHDPLSAFDIVGISISTELCFTGILTILDLGNVPLTSAERSENDPLVIGGGASVFNPEPVADFFDLFVMGDAEEVLPLLADRYADLKAQKTGRKDILRALADIEGVYVPSFFNVTYDGHRVAAITPVAEGLPKPRRAILKDLSQSPFPMDMVIPYGQPVFDRLTVEIDRGCTGGCRYCQAGMVYRPVRERRPDEVLAIIDTALKRTGYDDVSLASLSSGDNGNIEHLVTTLMDKTARENISVSLPSLRSGTLTAPLIRQIARVRKTGFTITAEAGSERLRRVINKKITNEEIVETARKVLAGGWRQLKLYFMIGLPTETDEDVEGIVRLVEEINRLREGNHKFQNINAGVSQFVPKAHTPFQWEPMSSMEENMRKKMMLSDAFRRMRGVQLKGHDVEMSWMEGVFSRGDRRLAPVVRRAYENGCRLDGWSEHFKLDVWREAFAECGVDPDEYVLRRRGIDETLPWDHLNIGISKKYLKRELKDAMAEVLTPDCRFDNCLGCGLPANDNVIQPVVPSPPISPAPVAEEEAPVYKYRLTFRKEGMARYLSHLEMLNGYSRALRRAALQAAHSGGFHPHVKIAFGAALPVGTVSLCEMVDIDLEKPVEPAILVQRLNAELERGIVIERAEARTPPYRSIQSATEKTLWIMTDNGSETPSIDAVKAVMDGIAGLTIISFEREGEKASLRFESTLEGFWGKLRTAFPGFRLTGRRKLVKYGAVMKVPGEKKSVVV